MRLILAALVLIFVSLPAQATQYYMSTSGSDGNNGTSLGTPWASPNHALNCGDVIQAAAGTTYNANSMAFGTVTCAGGNNVAWLTCVTFDACKSTISTGGQFSAGFTVTSSYWGISGWEVSTGSGEATCFFAFPGTTNVSIHHIIFANNVANGCGKAGFESSTNGTGGVDYFVVVGNIAYAAAAGSTLCESGINSFSPTVTDTLPGTHFYIAGNFSWNNVDPNPCNGTTPTDGQGIFFDTIQPYSQQIVVDNNISIYNGGPGIKAYNNNTGTPNAHIYFRHNTTYGNVTGTVNAGICAELGFQASLSSEAFANLAVTSAATACSGAVTYYALATTSGNSTDQVYSNYVYSAAGNNTSGSGTVFTNNISGTSPAFVSTTQPGAPSCGSASSVPNCMATVIANFTPTTAGAKPYGYQVPKTASSYDPLYPQWLCTVTSLPTGLVTPGCLTGTAIGNATIKVGATIK